MVVFTVGHSTRAWDDFLNILRAHAVQQLADVRTIPRSKRNPQFNEDALTIALPAEGIEYFHLPDLGGLRRPRPDSTNTGWRNDTFRGYADYMETDQFRHALDLLINLVNDEETAVMCAEAVPWRCHRSLLADALLTRGVEVEHILSATSRKPHSLTPFLKVDTQGNLSYEKVV
jgi:uncharacterized protein (DUF488 family)